MLRHLYIKDFVLINELNLDFHSGFSTFIGETGAGKSILIDAISILCADRASSSLVSRGHDKAIVEGTFDLSEDSHACKVLAEAGFDVNQEETTFTREISAAGKSTARIDHRIVTLQLMKDCLQSEIDIHGQRDNQYLLNAGEHIHLLDEYLQDHDQLSSVHRLYDTYHSLVQEKEQALQETYNENDLEYFQYEISEIEQAKLKAGEDEELEQKERQYKAVKNSFDKLNEIIESYDSEVSDKLYELNRLAQSLSPDLNLEDAKTVLNDSYFAFNDGMDAMRRALDSMDLSESDINEMEERLYTIQKLKHKYGPTIEAILEREEELEKQVQIISHRQEYLQEMDRRIEQALAAFKKEADVLSRMRRGGCEQLDLSIAQHLKDLELPNARFHTEIQACRPNPDGMDKVEFLISMNPGEDLKPLSRTASGGELSRLMLGLKVIFTRLEGIQTVIFDEIDTGVSGPVATAIGRKMRQLAGDCQVFAVTHLAPVAACAGHQYLVSKETADNHTRTMVSELSEQALIDQLALISSGSITAASRKAALELYRRNQD